MSPAIHCVLFDLDGVLADYDRGTRIETLARHLGRRAEAVHAAIYTSGVEDAGDAGMLDALSYLSALGASSIATSMQTPGSMHATRRPASDHPCLNWPTGSAIEASWWPC